MIAWETSATVPGASGLDFDIVVAASDDAGASWTTPIAVDRTADTDRRPDSTADLASGGPGKWFAAWTSRVDRPEKFGIAVLAADLVESTVTTTTVPVGDECFDDIDCWDDHPGWHCGGSNGATCVQCENDGHCGGGARCSAFVCVAD